MSHSKVGALFFNFFPGLKCLLNNICLKWNWMNPCLDQWFCQQLFWLPSLPFLFNTLQPNFPSPPDLHIYLDRFFQPVPQLPCCYIKWSRFHLILEYPSHFQNAPLSTKISSFCLCHHSLLVSLSLCSDWSWSAFSANFLTNPQVPVSSPRHPPPHVLLSCHEDTSP